MKMAELMQIFREAKNDANKAGAVTQGEMEVAGMAAVISALRNDGTFLKTWEEAQLAQVYRNGRIEFLATKPNASEIETVEAGIAAVIQRIMAGGEG